MAIEAQNRADETSLAKGWQEFEITPTDLDTQVDGIGHHFADFEQFRTHGFDNPPNLRILELRNLHSLFDQLRETLATSAQALQVNPSQENTNRVALSVLEQVSTLIAEHVPVPPTPASGSPARQAVFNTFERLGKLLGRNSENAIKADAAERIGQAAEKALESGESYGRRNGNGLEPMDWMKKQVVPHLDSDMVIFATPESQSFDLNLFRVGGLERLYFTLMRRKARQK